MPRGRTYDPRPTSGLTSDQLRSVALIPGLPQTFLAILENLSGKTSGALKPGEVANSELVPELIDIISDDYNNLSSEYLEASQRSSKLRLLFSCCSLLLPDLKSKQISSLLDLLCKLLNAASRVDKIIKLEEKLHILKLLTTFVSSSAEKIGDRLGEILGYLFVLSGLHKSSEGISLVPTNLPHLHFTQTQDGPRRESSCTDTSGSEFSDQEMISDVDARKRKEEGFIEKEALTAVDVIVKKCLKKDIVSYWFIFLPDKCYCPLQNGISSLLSHPCKKLRMASINILVDFLNHSHQFLALAQHQEKDTSYTSLSSALALSMLNLHKILLTRILEPLGNTEYVALLKLFAAVGENSSYSRLSPGLVDRMVNSLMELAERERNPVIQVAVLSVFVSLAHGPNIPDLKLVSREMFRFIRPRTLPVPQSLVSDNNVRYMSLQALSVLTQLDIQMFIKNATDVKSVIDISLQDSDPSIVLHTFRFIKNFAKYLTEVVVQAQEPESRLKNLTIAFWIDFLKPVNFQLLEKHVSANIRSAFCDCLAEIGPSLFSELPEPKRILCITFVLGQCKINETQDGTPDSKLQERAAHSACLRTLGIFVTFPCYLTDTAFHIDVVDAVLPHLPSILKDKKGKIVPDPGGRTVRVNASWALANLTDILVQAKQEMSRTGDIDEFPLSLIRRILQSGICCALESSPAVNTKSNAVRCIGNMLNYISEDLVPVQEYQDMMDKGTRAIISNISGGKIMKIRWNACYAAANILRKPDVRETSGEWIKDLVFCLSDTVLNFQNFKVRINAAYALGCIWSREVLGTQFLPVLQSLVSSLESSQNLEVFGEWQHQANLVNQLCLTICHLLSSVQNQSEFNKCAGMLFDNWDVVESSFQNSAKRISPEKFDPFLQAYTHVAGFNSRSEEESQVQTLLKNCTENIGG